MISSNVIKLLFATSSWLSSPNAAELCLLPDSAGQVSYAETFIEKDNGHWVDYAGSSDCYSWGVRAASVYRIDSRWVLDGQMEYSNFTGKEMSGSVWINPADRPFDIVETTTANAGTKNLETYQMAGGVSAAFQRLTVGARMDLTAANYAKRKDLRHQNKLMDMTTTLGALWRLNYRWSLGANFYYRRTIEELTFTTYGTTDQQYLSLIDYGACFGITEYSTASGLTDENSARPWVENRLGFDFQVNQQMPTGFNWYNDIHFDLAEGYYGKKSLYTPVFMEHNGIHWSYRSRLGIGHHLFGVMVSGSDITNYRNLYQYTTNSSGLNEYSYYGALETSNRKEVKTELLYQLTLNQWLFDAQMTHTHRNILASYYPYYRKQNLYTSTVDLSAKRLWKKSKHDWSASLNSGFRKGGGTRANDGCYESSSSTTSNLYTSDNLLNQQADYMTSTQGKVGVSVEYGRLLKQAPIRLYIRLNTIWHKAFDTTFEWEDTYRQHLEFSLGCSF